MICKPAPASVTVTFCRVLVMPSKKMPSLVMSVTADVESVGESFAQRLAWSAGGCDPIERSEARQLQRFHAQLPKREFHGRAVDRRIAERDDHVADEQDSRRQDFLSDGGVGVADASNQHGCRNRCNRNDDAEQDGDPQKAEVGTVDMPRA